MPDPTSALAMTAATTVVAAMATSAWQETRTRLAALFHRRGAAGQSEIEARLDDDARLVADDDDPDSARQDFRASWTRRLQALLREHPEAFQDVEDFVAAVRPRLPQPQQNWMMTVIARDHGTAYGVQGGNIYVDHHGSRAPLPPVSPSEPQPGN